MRTSSSRLVGILLLLGFLMILGACSEGTNAPPAVTNIIHEQRPTAFPATIELRVLERREGGADIGIVIENPEGVPIRSVRSWVRFEPGRFEVTEIRKGDGRFSLEAPQEWGIDSSGGLIRLGSAATAPIRDTTILFATFTVRGSGMLSFDDWRLGGDGHTAVLSVEDAVLRNIVRSPSPIVL